MGDSESGQEANPKGMINGSVEYEKMAQVEGTLWWYRILHKLTLKAIRDQYGTDTSVRILDLGCGTGGLMAYLKNAGYQNIRGIDLSETAVRISKTRGLEVVQGDMMQVSELVNEKEVDVLITNDTLYFIPEHERIKYLNLLSTRIRDKGLLVTNLPAMELFRGTHDITVGIEKRFEREETVKLFDKAGLKLLQNRFWPFTLSPLIYLVRSNQRRKINTLSNDEIESDVSLPSSPVNFLLHCLVAIEIMLIRSGPLGSSLFIVSQSKN